MVAAIRQIVKVQRGGVITLRSSELKVGDQAEVIVLVSESGKPRNGKAPKPIKEAPIAKMTKQVRGDIAWAKKVRAEGGPNIPWEQIKAERGL